MKTPFVSRALSASVFGLSVAFTSTSVVRASNEAAGAYKILSTTQIPAEGRIDYVTADSANRRVYVACGNTVSVFDLDTYKLAGSLPNAAGHGVAIDPENHTGLVSGNPATLFNTETLKVIKSIPAPGADGYLFDSFTHHFIILSHHQPNLLVVDSKDGTTVGTVDAIAPDGANAAVEQGVTDDKGHLYFDIANLHHIAVVDAKTLKVTGHIDLGEKGMGPAGLAFDVRNQILFAMCRGGKGGTPACVVANVDGKIITTLPLAGGSDGAVFNPHTMEAFSSHGNGTLSIIKENSPTDFAVEQTLTTKPGAKTCTLDSKKDHIILIAIEPAPSHSESSAAAASGARTLDVIFVGK